MLGGTPALTIALIRNNVHEPAKWEKKVQELGNQWKMQLSFFALFSPRYLRRTIFNSIYLIVSLVGLWAGSVYVPAAVTYLAAMAGHSPTDAAKFASYSTALLGTATVLTALVLPWLANRLGRRTTPGILFAVMLVSIQLAFGHVFYMHHHALAWFMFCAFFLGVGGANFVVYSFWLPEQYGTECRASAFAFTTNLGRFVAAGFTFLVGAGIHRLQTLGTPVSYTGFIFLAGMLLLPFGEETKGKLLPE